jgi:large subunit ribosomal protein L6
MSRIGKKPVKLPSGVRASIAGRTVTVEGPLGKLAFEHRPEVKVALQGQELVVARDKDERLSRALHGLTRAMLQNMVVGVTVGYEKKLELVGVGYIAAVDTKTNVLQLRVGFANEVQKPIPPGLKVTCPDQTHILIKGIDKQLVGQFAAEARAVRKPEPYKGKGIRYDGEQVRRKAGKAVTGKT